MKKVFYSNGKLLITGEYVVLDGASALAIPTKFGQSLEIIPTKSKGILWESLDENEHLWHQSFFELLDNMIVLPKGSNPISKVLFKILESAQNLNPNFLTESSGWKITTILDFPRNWGLGSSSTLINNIALWAEVDAYNLLFSSFGGSGFDIAAAQHDKPILYSKSGNVPSATIIDLKWEFVDDLFFVHLNKKQDSKIGIEHYRKYSVSKKMIQEISNLSTEIISCKTITDFERLVQDHEQLISQIIKQPTVKNQLFKEYPRTIKSLGAWGGDFVLAVGDDMDKDYFRNKGYYTILDFKTMLK